MRTKIATRDFFHAPIVLMAPFAPLISPLIFLPIWWSLFAWYLYAVHAEGKKLPLAVLIVNIAAVLTVVVCTSLRLLNN